MMTNREWLMSLTDEELAKFLCSSSQCALNCPVNRICYWDSNGRHNGFLYWLKMEQQEEQEETEESGNEE